jgi:hypothetical protein
MPAGYSALTRRTTPATLGRKDDDDQETKDTHVHSGIGRRGRRVYWLCRDAG